MTTKIPFQILKQLPEDLLSQFEYNIREACRDNAYMLRRYPEIENQSIKFDLTQLSKKQVEKLNKLIFDLNPPTHVLSALDRWLDILDAPDQGTVETLPALAKLLTEFYKQAPEKLLWKEGTDGLLLPWVVKNIVFVTAKRDYPAYVGISLDRPKIYKGDDYTRASVMFNYSDLFDEDENYKEPAATIYDEDEDEDEESEGKKKKTKTKPKPKAKPLIMIMQKKKCFLHTDKLLEEYQLILDKYVKTEKLIGKMYTSNASKVSFYKEDNDGAFSRYGSNIGEPRNEDGDFKFVVDTVSFERELDIPTALFGSVLGYPHPYVKMYDITKHRGALVNSETLIEYKYNKEIINQLVLDDDVKNILSGLIEGSTDVGDDVVSGKSGGMIILASGSPGIGKTLTAEIYSEHIEKPLYQIQSAQLGLNIESIENNLFRVLKRTEKWGAVLLIDEADSYIHERGLDMLQNCIVGTFLRSFEYFNGVMFLTTNKHDIIDKAILSRCVAHIRYEIPNENEANKIWKILAENYRLNISPEVIAGICSKNTFSGRDVRNSVKFLKKIFKEKQIEIADFELINKFRPIVQ